MAGRLKDVLRGLIRIVRPHQWSKNLFVLAPLVFSKELGIFSAVLGAFLAAFLFCLASGAVYTMNDMVDAPRDRLHPVKKNRPIASGMLPVEIASAYAVFLAGISIGASIYFGYEFVVTLLIYLVLNIVYSFWLKKVVIVDVVSIAAGFLLRVIAGSYAARVEASIWILAVTFLLALFLALGKRRHELLVSQEKNGTRPVLRMYSPRLVKIMMNVVAMLTVAAYSVYTLSPHTREYFQADYLFVSIPFVLFGLWRFIRLSDIKERNESPTEALIRDVPFILNGLLWFVVITAIIYFI
ncbi:MAG: decaprenyl-phosphate phosphoribosyltransferase [Pseudomonadota bacterium]